LTAAFAGRFDRIGAMQHRLAKSAADILIPVRDDCLRTEALLEGIYRHADFPFHIYVLDSGPAHMTAALGKIFTRDITIARARTCRSRAGAINYGIGIASNPYLVFLNTDVELAHGWLGNLIAFLETHPRIAAVGPLDSGPDHWQCVDCVRDRMVPQIPQFFTEDIHVRNRILQYHFEGTGILVDRPLDFFCAAFRRRAVNRVGNLTANGSGTDDAEYCRRLREAGFVLGLSLATYVGRRPRT
jgi:GT2 family glycosyltransferase